MPEKREKLEFFTFIWVMALAAIAGWNYGVGAWFLVVLASAKFSVVRAINIAPTGGSDDPNEPQDPEDPHDPQGQDACPSG